MFDLRKLLLPGVMLMVPLLASANPGMALNPLLEEGAALLQQGRTVQAISSLQAAERRLPNPADAAPLLGEAYLKFGMQSLGQMATRPARDAFVKAKGYIPRDYRPYQAMALAWLHEGQPVPATAELYEALALGGERSDLYMLLGRAHYESGQLDQAEEAWVKAAELGAADEAAPHLEKVRRELRAEKTMRRDLAGRFTLAYAQGVSDALAGEVLEVLEDAYQAVGRDLNYYPEADIPVLLYARDDFAAVTRSPGWAAAVYDGKVRVPLGGVDKMSAPLRALLHHEYVHVVVRFLGKGRAPVWLNEGIAEVVERRLYETPQADSAPTGAKLPEGALDRPFVGLPDDQVRLAYQQSHERVRRLVNLCGWPPVGELLQRLGAGEKWEAAVAGAYAPCGYDWPRLQVELLDQLH